MHQRIWKNLFALGVDEYLERLEGKIRKCLFFYVKIFWNNSLSMEKNNDEERSLEKFLEQDSKKQGSLLPYLLNLY